MSEREFRESMQERWNAEVLEQLYAIRKLLETLVEGVTQDSYSATVGPESDQTDSLHSGG